MTDTALLSRPATRPSSMALPPVGPVSACSLEALCETARRARGLGSPTTCARGAALVLLSEGCVIWHVWHTDSATAQRLAVNTCLKSIVWTTACATKAAGAGLPALDVDVSLHVLAPDAAPIAIDAGRGDRPDWLAFWLVAGGPLSVAYADGVLDAATGDDAGDMLVGGMTPGIASQMGCAVLGGRDRFRTSTERVVAELRVHRLAHAHG